MEPAEPRIFMLRRERPLRSNTVLVRRISDMDGSRESDEEAAGPSEAQARRAEEKQRGDSGWKPPSDVPPSTFVFRGIACMFDDQEVPVVAGAKAVLRQQDPRTSPVLEEIPAAPIHANDGEEDQPEFVYPEILNLDDFHKALEAYGKCKNGLRNPANPKKWSILVQIHRFLDRTREKSNLVVCTGSLEHRVDEAGTLEQFKYEVARCLLLLLVDARASKLKTQPDIASFFNTIVRGCPTEKDLEMHISHKMRDVVSGKIGDGSRKGSGSTGKNFWHKTWLDMKCRGELRRFAFIVQYVYKRYRAFCSPFGWEALEKLRPRTINWLVESGEMNHEHIRNIVDAVLELERIHEQLLNIPQSSRPDVSETVNSQFAPGEECEFVALCVLLRSCRMVYALGEDYRHDNSVYPDVNLLDYVKTCILSNRTSKSLSFKEERAVLKSFMQSEEGLKFLNLCLLGQEGCEVSKRLWETDAPFCHCFAVRSILLHSIDGILRTAYEKFTDPDVSLLPQIFRVFRDTLCDMLAAIQKCAKRYSVHLALLDRHVSDTAHLWVMIKDIAANKNVERFESGRALAQEAHWLYPAALKKILHALEVPQEVPLAIVFESIKRGEHVGEKSALERAASADVQEHYQMSFRLEDMHPRDVQRLITCQGIVDATSKAVFLMFSGSVSRILREESKAIQEQVKAQKAEKEARQAVREKKVQEEEARRTNHDVFIKSIAEDFYNSIPPLYAKHVLKCKDRLNEIMQSPEGLHANVDCKSIADNMIKSMVDELRSDSHRMFNAVKAHILERQGVHADHTKVDSVAQSIVKESTESLIRQIQSNLGELKSKAADVFKEHLEAHRRFYEESKGADEELPEARSEGDVTGGVTDEKHKVVIQALFISLQGRMKPVRDEFYGLLSDLGKRMCAAALSQGREIVNTIYNDYLARYENSMRQVFDRFKSDMVGGRVQTRSTVPQRDGTTVLHEEHVVSVIEMSWNDAENELRKRLDTVKGFVLDALEKHERVDNSDSDD